MRAPSAAGLLALLLTRDPIETTVAGAGGAVVAAVLGIGPAFRALLGEPLDTIIVPWGSLQGAFHIEAARILGMHPNSLLRLIRTLDLKTVVKAIGKSGHQAAG